jgi:GTP:adenosylcobinamide-phosphate guanylyltransferase
VSLDPAHGEVNSIKENVIKFVRLVAYSAGIPVSCTNKTYCHDITEILLKVALVTLLVEEDLPSLPEHAISSVAFRKIRVAQLLVFWVRVTNATFNNISFEFSCKKKYGD